MEAENRSTAEGFAAFAADKTDMAFPYFPRPFDPARYVDTPEAMSESLAAAFERGEHTMIAGALGALAKARGTFGSGIRLALFV